MHLFLHCSQHRLSLIVGEQHLATRKTIFHASDENCGVEWDRLFLKALAHSFCRIHPECVAELILLGFQYQRSR